MPTLLSINNYYYVRGGAEAVFLSHNDMFQDLGWDVVPFSMKHEQNMHSEWSEFFVDEIELGSRYGFFDLVSKSIKAIYSREAQRKIDRLIQTVKPDIAHGHNIYHHISPSVLSTLKSAGVPTLLTLHDLKLTCPAYKMMTRDGICERCKGGRLWNAATNRCMHDSAALSLWVAVEAYLHRILGSYSKNVDQFIVPSQFYIDKFAEWGWPRDRFTYIPNFVNAADIQPNFEPGKEFVYIGRLSSEKGLETFIKAAAVADVNIQIIGTGPEGRRLMDLANNLRISVEFPGYVAGEALFDRLRSARAVVLPSEWYENAPISVIEAYAAGKPVIGADIGGIPELITSERGSTFEAFSTESLAQVLRRFDEMPDARLELMGRAARSYVEEVHSREAYLEKCRAAYETLI